MDSMRRSDSGASEVIGAVLLVSIVVIGGAVVAAFVFGQPAPQKVPHVNFGVSLDAANHVLTLHHTGGDTLSWGEYAINVEYTDGTGFTADPTNMDDYATPWASDGDKKIRDVTKEVGTVILSYRDNAGGETVLRRVQFEDHAPVNANAPPVPWTISGYKRNVTQDGQLIEPLEGVVIRLNKTAGNIDFPAEGRTTTTNETGYYSFTVDQFEATYSLDEMKELNLSVWKPISPPTGRYDGIRLTRYQSSAFFKNFSNYRLPPPPKTISGHKYNVTWKGAVIGPLEGVAIHLTLASGDVPSFPEQGKTVTTDANGYYEFEVPGWWDFEPPAEIPTYRIAEEIDLALWRPHNPHTGAIDPTAAVIENVPPGATDQDFWNERLVPNKKIWGYKWGYYTNGDLIGPVPGVPITLTMTSGATPDMTVGQSNHTTTNGDGYYEFEVSGHTLDGGNPVLYRLQETPNLLLWTIWQPASGVFENVPPGARRDFSNMHVVPPPLGGRVIRLEKTQPPEPERKGHLVGGTYLQFETHSTDYVQIGTTRITFNNGDEIRFVLNGNQSSGRMTVTKGGTDLVEWTFNTSVQRKVHGEWTTIRSGPVTDVSITNINKNGIIMDSTLAYRMPAFVSSNTALRLDGKPVITAPPEPLNGTPLEFVDLHIVHDNRYHDDLNPNINNIMWVYLTEENNSLLVEGNYVYV